MGKVGKESHRKRKSKFFLKLLQGLRSQLTWRELLVGLLSAILLAAILAGFRQQVIPEFKVGDVANQDVRASKGFPYVDEEATTLKRNEARASVPDVYELAQDRISEVKSSIRNAFQQARDYLAEKSVPLQGSINSRNKKIYLTELQVLVGDTFSEEILPPLLRDRFNATLERRIIDIFDEVLGEGILEDPERFSEAQRVGIIIRDSSYPFEHLRTDANLVRDLPEAREYLREFNLDLIDWTEGEKDSLLQFMQRILVPTLVYNRKETETRKELAASQVPAVEVQIKSGQTVVQYGQPITENLLSQLNALRNLWKPASIIMRGIGFFIFIVVLLYALWRYLVFFKSKIAVIRKNAALILVIIASELFIIRFASVLADILDERFHWFQDPSTLYYAIPFALGPLLVTLLVDVNFGVMTSIILAALIALFYGDISIALYFIMGSLAGIYSIRQYKDRVAILNAGFAIGVLNCICFAGIYILRQNHVSFPTGLYLAFLAFVSGLVASTIASIMLPPLEYLFKIVTDIRLLELSNLNDPILRRLSVEAPGTYHHSLMVATLAEDAAEAIGANPLLTRVSAYYHDIGKILKPEYFVENQSMEYNKHEQISPRMSCLVLASHVKDGLQLAKEIGLPQPIRDIIPQHHGTRMMSYFFQKAKNTFDKRNGSVSDSDFRYSGPKPQSKEAAIMMMADSVEAASRTLSDPNPSQIRGMIDRLVDGIIRDAQFDECDITFKDVRLVKESFFKIITGIFHRRIDYPNYDFRHSSGKSDQTPVPDSDTKQAKTV